MGAMGWDRVRAYVDRMVDVVVQLERRDGPRRVSGVRFWPSGSDGAVERSFGRS
jgi:hypothetical protein